ERVAGGVADDETRTASRSGRETVDDVCAVRRVRVRHHRLTVAVAWKTELRTFTPLEAGLRREEMRARRVGLRRHLLERGDVDDPEAAPVRRGDELVIARMDLKIENRNRREVRGELVPRLAAVDRREDRARATDEQQVAVMRILTDHVQVIRRA